MRSVVTTITLLAVSTSAFGVSIKRDTRDDWRSLDCSIRWLEREGEAGIPRALEHLKPMKERRRTFMLSRVRLGTDDEVRLVNRQNTRADRAHDSDDTKKVIIVSVLRWLYHFVIDLLETIIPGAGFMVPIVIALYLYIRYKDRVIKAFISDAEKLDKGERQLIFTSPEVVGDYNRRKRKGKL